MEPERNFWKRFLDPDNSESSMWIAGLLFAMLVVAFLGISVAF